MATKKVKKSKVLADIRMHREENGINQTEFWSRLGSTQSAGSRYEGGRTIPAATAVLIVLLERGLLSDSDLADAMKSVEATIGFRAKYG